MKKETALALSAAVAAAGAGAAAFFLLRKKSGKASQPAGKADASPVAPKNTASGSYSFVSGYKDAKEVNAAFSYNADGFACKVIEDEFLTYTSDSHVAVLYGDEYSVQIEYSDYYSGDSFEKLATVLAEKYTGFEKLAYGSNTVYKYYDGSNVCFCVPATEFSYLLITAVLGKNSKIDYTQLAGDSDLSYILSSISIR